MLPLRLSSVIGRPIRPDLTALREDVHCGSATQEIHPEFRQETARFVLESKRQIAHVRRGVGADILGKWIKAKRVHQGSADGHSDASIQDEIARLRRELAEAKMDTKFLSKPSASFVMSHSNRKNLS